MGKTGSWTLATLLVLGLSGPVAAQVITEEVTSATELLAAINAANSGASEGHSITIAGNITLDRSLAPIASGIAFVGVGDVFISGDDRFPIFFVDTNSPVSIANLTLRNGNSQGGDGGARRSGGGLGAGGALFVNQNGNVTLTDVRLLNNTAQGGSGGTDDSSGGNAGGGGGGFHGNGGDFGGGGGWNGDGASNGGGGGGLFGNGESSEGVGIPGGNGGGKDADGAGGPGDTNVGGTGRSGGEFEGGGFGNTGGDGGRFGGGGGSSGGNAGRGGDFGGGGGSAGRLDGSSGGSGGNGGWGAGGGASANGTTTTSAFGGGGGVVSGPGGAGASLGGAVFVREGGRLTYRITSDLQATSGNSVSLAVSGSGNPEVAGEDLYVMNNVEANFDTTAVGVTAELTGSIAGAGGLRKSGPGTLTLSGSNSYTGSTVVENDAAGTNTLQGNTNSLQGDILVESGAALRFNQSQAGTYSGAISGVGSIDKQGGGSVTFSGNNSYTGSTTVVQGNLIFTSSTLPETTASISSGATLRFDLATNASFSGSIDGSGRFDKAGLGSLTLSQDSLDFTGTSTVSAGELRLASGKILASGIDVLAGARLSGTGSAQATGDVTVSGTLAPGAPGSTGILELGNLDLLSGGNLEIHVTPVATNADQIVVQRDATLAPNTTLTLLPGSGDYAEEVTFNILTAGGNLESSIAVGSSFCLLDAEVAPVGNTLQLTVGPALERLVACADTANQTAVADALTLLLDEDPDDLESVKNELFTVATSEVPAALDLMGGAGLAGFQSTRLAAASHFLGTLSQRIRDTSVEAPGPAYPLAHSIGGPLMPSLGEFAGLGDGLASSVRMAATHKQAATPFSFVSLRGESGVGGFLDGFATFAGIQGDGNSSDTDFNLYGTNAGVDWAFADGALIGAAFGYTRSKLSVSDLATWGSGDTFQGAVYGGYATDLFYLDGAARYGYTQMKTTRRISFGDSLFETAKGDFNGLSLSGYAEIGLAPFDLAGTYFQPTAAFQYTYVQTDDFIETGAPGLNLGVLTPSVNSMVSNAGVRIYRPFKMDNDADIVPELRVRYAHEFGDTNRPVAARFAPATTPKPFTVKAAEIGRDVAILGAGWAIVGDGDTSLSLQYDATVNSEILAHTVTVGLLLFW
jgi:autotransporter-associated beta strand protein